jgi:uncharacterized membrane protein YjjP (DUF1212 family)
LDAKRNPALTVVNMIVGVLMVLCALVWHLIIPGIPFALLIVGGVLLIITGVLYR